MTPAIASLTSAAPSWRRAASSGTALLLALALLLLL
jgi:hypothetical protein